MCLEPSVMQFYIAVKLNVDLCAMIVSQIRGVLRSNFYCFFMIELVYNLFSSSVRGSLVEEIV